MHQNMAFNAKAVDENMQLNFSRNVGETEQYPFRHLHYACAFAHCTNWLVKLPC
jgi:hypothetical protein